MSVADDEAAKMWAGKVAKACGWPHEVRRFKPRRPADVFDGTDEVGAALGTSGPEVAPTHN